MDTPKGVGEIRPPCNVASAAHVKAVDCGARTGSTGNFKDSGVPAAKILVPWMYCLLHNGDLIWRTSAAEPTAIGWAD